ncbi:hypothetical protein C8Q80DRAFT_250686 [Daedaleopsis nitida]|nr:hypothetical protein C8Q80DRAFT_250686 [Daedaleopsis nitida]
MRSQCGKMSPELDKLPLDTNRDRCQQRYRQRHKRPRLMEGVGRSLLPDFASVTTDQILELLRQRYCVLQRCSRHQLLNVERRHERPP